MPPEVAESNCTKSHDDSLGQMERPGQRAQLQVAFFFRERERLRLRKSGDKSGTRTKGTTRSSLCNCAWAPQRMADLDVDVGNALNATRHDTRGNAHEERARRLRKTLLALLALESKPPVWACQARGELTPGYDTLWLAPGEESGNSCEKVDQAGPEYLSECSLM